MSVLIASTFYIEAGALSRIQSSWIQASQLSQSIPYPLSCAELVSEMLTFQSGFIPVLVTELECGCQETTFRGQPFLSSHVGSGG